MKLAKLNTREDQILEIIRSEKTIWEDYIINERQKLEADLILLRNNKRDWIISDTTMFNVHSALVARSFKNKTNIKFKWDKTGWNIDRQIKMLNNTWKEDTQTSYMKALKYWNCWNKFACGVSITAKVGWDWVYKRNIFKNINPLTVIPDPFWDYFTWNYRYIWFLWIKTVAELKKAWYDLEDITKWSNWDGAIDIMKQNQINQWLNSPDDSWLIDTYTHFTEINWKKAWFLLVNDCRKLIDWGIIEPWNPHEEKNPEAIEFPFAFHYRKPLEWNFYWDRIANYTRDIQKQKSVIAQLRLDKMKAELYPMYLYNKDFVSWTDLMFWFNKWIPIKGWITWEVNLSNIVAPVPKDLRIDTSIQVEDLLNRQVEKATSVWDVAQGTTPDKRETLWTNQLIQSNTDINLSLNEEIDWIWDEQLINIWFKWYYQNFSQADKKLIYASSSTWEMPITLKRKDFIYEWNLALSIETTSQANQRKREKALAIAQITPLILQDWSINEWYKRNLLRLNAEMQGLELDEIDSVVWKTAEQIKQQWENQLLLEWIMVNINPSDDDEQHLLEMWNMEGNLQFELHRMAHIQARLDKVANKNILSQNWLMSWWQEQGDNKGLLNSASAQSMNMVAWEKAKLDKQNI